MRDVLERHKISHADSFFKICDQKISGFNRTETENIPTMVKSAPYNQGSLRIAQTRQSSKFDASSYNGIDSSSIANVPTMVRAAMTLKQENDTQKQCEYNDVNYIRSLLKV